MAVGVSAAASQTPLRVGVLVVHGIGEQRRFEHLDGQVRDIVKALRDRPGAEVTVDVASTQFATFRSEQDTWDAGATVRVLVRDPKAGNDIDIRFHEVWWADVNEPYSVFKQIRFWAWGLAIWAYPRKEASNFSNARDVYPPRAPTERSARERRVLDRVRLFGVAFIAVIGTASVGIISFLAERVLKTQVPNFVRVFVNYLSAVKLYNQRRRFGTGLTRQVDFLDNMQEPPRVSVRRRMIRSLMDMAEGGYERWYVLAHSLGSVIAYNGLMEPAYSWPGYFDEKRWTELRSGPFVGDAVVSWTAPTGPTMPRRPIWAREREIAYRRRIFANFRGFLSFGSPLEKFATIWPARVPICREPAFSTKVVWFNIYDPIDPVSGVLRSFDDRTDECSPKPQNKGYEAGDVLLANHLHYLSPKKNGKGLCDAVADWLVTGSPRLLSKSGKPWYGDNSSTYWVRNAIGIAWWFAGTATLLVLGALVLPAIISPLSDIMGPFVRYRAALAGIGILVDGWINAIEVAYEVPHAWWSGYCAYSLCHGMVTLSTLGIILPLVAALISRVLFRPDADTQRLDKTAFGPQKFTPVKSPEP
jgi:hypothetical protein